MRNGTTRVLWLVLVACLCGGCEDDPRDGDPGAGGADAGAAGSSSD